MHMQVKDILAAALERGPVRMPGSAAEPLLAEQAATGHRSDPDPAEEAEEEAADEGATPGALSDAALVVGSVLASLPASEVGLSAPWAALAAVVLHRF